MWKYDLALEKCWVKQSGCFRLATTVKLIVGITAENKIIVVVFQREKGTRNVLLNIEIFRFTVVSQL